MQRTSPMCIAGQAQCITQPAGVPYVSRVMSSEIRRLRYVISGLSQLEAHASSNTGELNTSAIQTHNFVAESSNETPFERFLVWDPVSDPNVVYARPAIAEAIRRNIAAAAALNALPEPDEGEDDAAEDEQDSGEGDDAANGEVGDDGTGSDDDDMGGILIEGE